MKARKYYYSIEFPEGVSYIMAVSKRAARRQAQRAKGTVKERPWQFDTLKRITEAEYARAHKRSCRYPQS